MKPLSVISLKETMVMVPLLLTMMSCSHNSDYRMTAIAAGPHIDSIIHIPDSYPLGSNEHKAACWILSNITSHYTHTSPAVMAFEDKVMNTDSAVSRRWLNNMWHELGDRDSVFNLSDARVISPEFLKADMESAVSVWEQSAWKEEVPFDLFCRYILPYRVYDEPLRMGTRDSLYKEYHSAIEGITDVKKAFAAVHNLLNTRVKAMELEFTHNSSALMMEKMRMGNCLQRCIHEVSVLRSLGIPAVVDCIPCWANYSTKGHSWVALVTTEGTFTMPDRSKLDGYLDSIPSRPQYVGSSFFHVRSKVEDDYPYPTDFRKRHSVVNRIEFEYQLKEFADENADERVRGYFTYPFYKDVSSDYGCQSTVIVEDFGTSSYAYLCTYRTAYGWTPVAYSKKENNQFRFSHIGDSILCLLMVAKDKILYPIGSPFLISGKEEKYLTPDTLSSDSAVLDRKYPLVGRFINIWAELVGGAFEGSNDAMFTDKRVLAKIENTPVYRNALPSKSARYRYVRYLSPETFKTLLSEIEIYSAGTLEYGTPFAQKVKSPERCFDRNTYTMPNTAQTGYSVGLDFGKPVQIDSIVFYPKNDDNFVRPDHEFELNYFCDGHWIPIECTSRQAYTLTYNNIPHNSLLLLRDLTAGKEERPFILRNGKVEWW